jgi:hypothetical protein
MKISASRRAEPELFSASYFHGDYSTFQLYVAVVAVAAVLAAGRAPTKAAGFRCFFKLDKASS